MDIAICTPGRLLDMIDMCKVSLGFVQTLILDEADAMLNLGFRPMISSLIQDRDMPDEYQTFLFSATYPPDLVSLIPSVMRKARYIRLA
ncbi:atp-dependent rna helicase ded1, partial [Cystoisospora suis]